MFFLNKTKQKPATFQICKIVIVFRFTCLVFFNSVEFGDKFGDKFDSLILKMHKINSMKPEVILFLLELG